ncbi:MAG: CoA-binding protein [Gemmatimonadota bacterium]|nr:MAG: CoA-binding protein [Gemmatimonadota bacterium]
MLLDPQTIEIIKEAKTIAVVGCSPKSYRDSNSVARYLTEQGYAVVPINPKHDMILGVRCYADLLSAREAEGPIDIVNIFRASDLVPPHVKESIEIGAKLVWMQLGVINEEAALEARSAGVTVVMDQCLRTLHKELRRERLL